MALARPSTWCSSAGSGFQKLPTGTDYHEARCHRCRTCPPSPSLSPHFLTPAIFSFLSSPVIIFKIQRVDWIFFFFLIFFLLDPGYPRSRYGTMGDHTETFKWHDHYLWWWEGREKGGGCCCCCRIHSVVFLFSLRSFFFFFYHPECDDPRDFRQ